MHQEGRRLTVKEMSKLVIYILIVLAIVLAGCGKDSSSVQQPTRPASATNTPRLSTSGPVLSPTFTATLEPLPTDAAPPQTNTGTPVIDLNNVQQLGVIARFGRGTAYDFSWSPTDDLFVINSSTGLQLYDAKTWKQIQVLEPVDAFDWSPDGSLFAVTSPDIENSIQIYNGKSFEHIKHLQTGNIFGWSSNGQWLATLDSSRIYLYDANSLELTRIIQTGEPVWAFTISPLGTWLATLGDQVQLWDTATGKRTQVLDGNSIEADWINDFAFSPDENTLVFLGGYGGGFDFVFEAWDTETGQNIHHEQGIVGRSYAIDSTFSPNGDRIALFVYENITIVDSQSGQIQKTISTVDVDQYIDSTVQVLFSSDGEKIISTAGIFDIYTGTRLSEQGFPEFQVSSRGMLATSPVRDSTAENTIQLWEVANSQRVNSLPGQYSWRYDISFNHGGQYLASFDEYGNVQVHEVATSRLLQRFEFDSDIYDLVFGPTTTFTSGYVLGISDQLGDIHVWDIGKNKDINRFVGSGETENAIAISPNGQFLAHQAREGDIIQVDDIFTGKVLRQLTGAERRVQQITFSPNGKTIVAGSSNYVLYIWEVTSGQLLNQVNGNGYDFAFRPNTEHLAWGYGNSIQIWDVEKNQMVADLVKAEPGVEEWYLSVAFSSDGQLLAAGTSNGLIDIWDLETKQIIRTLRGHETIHAGHDLVPMADVESLTFNKTGNLLASSGVDCSMRLWNVDMGTLITTFPACGPVAFSPDSTFLAYASNDKMVTLLGIP